MRRHAPIIALLLGLTTACEGFLEAGPSGPRDTGRRGDDPSCEAAPRPFDPMTRLTRGEYARTVRDLLGDERPLADAFPADDRVGETGFEVGRTVSPLLVEAQLDAAEQLAASAVLDLDRLLPCDPSTIGEAVCAEDFVRTFGRRAWRRALGEEEVARVMALYAEGASDGGFVAGIELAVHGMLSAPWFLYHVDARADDVAGASVQRTSFELASKLSYLIWGSMPDDALLDAAEQGRLVTEEDAVREARRLLEDPRAREGVGSFFDGWLRLERIAGIQRDETFYPAADRELAQGLERSARAFVDWAFWEENSFDALFRSDKVFLDERLSSVYGGEVATSALTPISLPERRGVLTQPGLLALLAKDTQSSPIQRGVFVRTAILCQELPPPPMDVNFTVPPPEPGLSTRDRFAAHTADPSCASCHRLIDPVGFAFERYDAIGLYRERDSDVDVDSSAMIEGTLDADGPVGGALELADRLAASEEVADCYVEQWARFALRRTLARDDQCALEDLQETFGESDGDLRGLAVELAASAMMRERRVADDANAP